MAPKSSKADKNTKGTSALQDAIRKVFERAYVDYQTFKTNVLDSVFTQYRHEDLFEDFTENCEYAKFFANQPIEHFYEKGRYKIENNKVLNIYEVVIKDSVKIHRARVGIQALLRQATFLKTGQSALMIFRYANPEGRSWRLSYLAKTGDIEGNVHYTAAKRYTYIFGPNCHVRTAVERFAMLAGTAIKLDDLTAAFSVEAVTKEFYTKLFDWYEWAQQEKFNVTFPNDIATKEDDRDERLLKQHLIRLITRLIFVWFIKQKGLVSDDLFNAKIVNDWMVDFDPMAGCNGDGCAPQTEHTTSYYHGILQNLFFATLNNAMGKAKDENGNVLKDEEGHELDSRRFAFEDSDEVKRSEHYLYRYASLFTESGKKALLQQLNRTPFLNGGLFECLDKHQDKASPTEHSIIYSDGFSREAAMQDGNFKCRAFIPNVLFFNDDNNQPGLITLLKQYNFTVEENTPDEEQVALDPELLGKIFENLLASYNPETAETARKSTGSYYTPREIVHYMAEQSIAECLKTKLKEKFCSGKKYVMTTDDLDKAIDELMQGDECPDSLKLARRDIENALFSMKILDPACGSGAFPMGVMQCMLAILAKIKDSKTFDEKQHEYKLKIIGNCLYGVDIQPIAVQISKLRCFISLVIDETPDLNNPNNLGITVLPNLETKFVCANSLIPLDDAVKTPEVKQISLIDTWLDKVNKAKNELWNIRESHFAAKTFADKERLRKADEAKRDELRELYKAAKVSSEEVEKLLSWNPYDQTVSNSFFDPEWMLGVKGGFDIVIGNPPYLESRNSQFSTSLKNKLQSILNKRYPKKEWFPRGSDLLVYFYELSIRIMNDEGINAFITQNSWLSTDSGSKFQKYLINNTNTHSIIDSDYKYFETANINAVITFFKGHNKQSTEISYIKTHESFRDYPISAFRCGFLDERVIYKKFLPKNENTIKWGELIKDDLYLDILKLVDSKGKKINEINEFYIGQGLNISKKCIFTEQELKEFRISKNIALPFYNKRDGSLYYWNQPSCYIVNSNGCELHINGHEFFDFSKINKKPPVLILPRGIGDKHFCCYNSLNGFSASYVDIYSNNSIELTDNVLRLWLYFNSSLFWLIRENSGRTNLGGGMLKAEAIDIKSHAILFPLDINNEIINIFNMVKDIKVSSVKEEVLKSHHQKIDEIIFNHLGLNNNQREFVISSLCNRVFERTIKSKNKQPK